MKVNMKLAIATLLAAALGIPPRHHPAAVAYLL